MIDAQKLEKMRVDYQNQSLTEEQVNPNPFKEFSIWFHQAEDSQLPEPNAMALATVDQMGKPSCRIVLLKGLDENGFLFFTNYLSRKGKDMEGNPNAALTFNWLELHRQVRIEGIIEKISREESIRYFNQRPYESRIGAAVSPQSSVINGKKDLEMAMENMMEETKSNLHVDCPEHWGGYRVIPNWIEFWQGRFGRLHDRIVYQKNESGWKILRLAP